MKSWFSNAIVGCMLLFFSGTANGQGIDFFHGSWEEALIEAQKQGKPIFVDCFTTWCGPCKRMARDVFPDAEVGLFYNEHFINLKMDMEKGEGPDFGKKYPVGAYPTLYYIKPDGEVIFAQRGARGVKEFIDLGKAAVGRAGLGKDVREAYEAGDREPAVILEYVKTLNRSGESSLKVVNDYLRTNPDLNDSTTLAIVIEGVTESDSRPFTVLTDNRGKFSKIFGQEIVDEKIHQACEATAQKAIEFEYYPLVEQAVDEMKRFAPSRYEEFRYTAPMDYHMAYYDWGPYKEVADEYVRKVIGKDAQRRVDLARSIADKFKHEPGAIAYAEELMRSAVKYGDNWSYEYELAKFYYQVLKDKEKALDQAKRALKLARKQDGNPTEVEQFIEHLEGKGVQFMNN